MVILYSGRKYLCYPLYDPVIDLLYALYVYINRHELLDGNIK